MKRYAQMFIILVVGTLVVLAGCQQPTDDTTDDTSDDDQAGLEVGDDIGNGFTVSYIDPAGGYEATNDDVDLDGDGTADEDQTKVVGTFSEDRTWSSDRVYYLDGLVFIGEDDSSSTPTLTIEEGTTIKGLAGTTPGTLVIQRHAQINADGTASEPIVMTSALPEGSRAAGDWGGLVINGRAPSSEGDNVESEGNAGQYGGDVDDDSSGTLRYVRVEYAGRIFTSDDELNGIAFQGVGSGTTVEYIQVHQNKDDGVEFFGGTVSVRYVVLTGNQDDSMDATSGWRGSAQNVIVVHYPGAGDRGIEMDGLEGDNDATPKTQPLLANFTILGNGTTADDSRGVEFRRGMEATLYNSYIGNVRDVMDVSDSDGPADWLDLGGIFYENGLSGLPADGDTDNTTDSFDTVPTAVTAPAIGVTPGTATDSVASGWDLTPDSAIGTGVDLPSAVATNPADNRTGSLVDADYVGAVDPNGTDWYLGWTTNSAD